MIRKLGQKRYQDEKASKFPGLQPGQLGCTLVCKASVVPAVLPLLATLLLYVCILDLHPGEELNPTLTL